MIECKQKYAYKCRMDFLTTREAAEYVRLGERKLYELVTSGAIPCSKVAGKWLFPRHELDLWVLSGLARPAGMIVADPPPFTVGSQPGAGAQWRLDLLLSREGAGHKDLRRLDPPRLTGPDLAAAIRSGKADCGIASRAAAKAAGLDFVPLLWENFDLLMRQRSYFRPSIQALIGFIGHKRLKQRAAELTGYDTTPAGQIRFAA